MTTLRLQKGWLKCIVTKQGLPKLHYQYAILRVYSIGKIPLYMFLFLCLRFLFKLLCQLTWITLLRQCEFVNKNTQLPLSLTLITQMAIIYHHCCFIKSVKKIVIIPAYCVPEAILCICLESILIKSTLITHNSVTYNLLIKLHEKKSWIL